MSDDVRIKVSGLRELDRALAELPKATGKNVLRRVGRKALKPMIEDARAKVPVASGKLRDSLQVATKLSKRQQSMHRKMFRDDKASVEVFAGAAALPHAHLVEFGTGPRYTKDGRYTGQMPPQPFMRPAWDANKGRILDDIAKDLGDEITKAAKRLAKKALR